ncbi:MAG: type IV pilus modification protein PilV [Granulosicoccaceae bacterium]
MNKRLQTINNSVKRHADQRGIGIIEILVALVVVSFGVLGMASLQLTGMKHSTGGFNRSKALMFAESIATRMRINSVGVENAYYGDFNSDLSLSCGTNPKICQATPGNPNPQLCTTQELAAFDLFTVACGDIDGSSNAREGVTTALPGGQISVACENNILGICGPKSTHIITVSWQEGSGASDDKTDVQNKLVQVRLQP